ncbi:MAG: AraC family ligand binding domain-containing protein, partial [Clostridiales bacterium]|nr:AraC family ligand binding domain-containing protein [Clostridiales bacterium]
MQIMDYVKTTLSEVIRVMKIVTVHYFEYAKNFVFEGEAHDFWEFLYVDKGEVEVTADSDKHELTHGDIIFHKPDEFHNVCANGVIAPNLVVVAFECKSAAMRYFENKVLRINNEERNLLAAIIKEAKSAFSSPLDQPTLKKLDKAQNPTFGSEQLIRIYLEQLLISLKRKGPDTGREKKLSTSVKEKNEDDRVKKIIEFMEYNINQKLTFDQICNHASIGSSNLKVIFREKAGCGVMEYFGNMKIAEAKKLIREA